MMIFQMLTFSYILFRAWVTRKLKNDLAYQLIDILKKNLNHLYSFGC